LAGTAAWHCRRRGEKPHLNSGNEQMGKRYARSDEMVKEKSVAYLEEVKNSNEW